MERRGRLGKISATAMAAIGLQLTLSSPVVSQPQPGVPSDRESMYRHMKAARELAGTDLYAHYVHRCIIDQTYRRTLSRSIQAKGAIEATRVFDNLYFVGDNSVSSWALDTGEGIILFDALNSPEDVRNTIEPGLRKFGLDPANIRYLVITHAHGDHYGGSRYLRDHYGTRIIASERDWEEMTRQHAGQVAGFPAAWAALVPDHDIGVHDGEQFTLGGAVLTFYVTPGHTPGTLSTIFDVTDGGEKHVVGFFGGFGTPNDAEEKRMHIASMERFKSIVRDRNVDVLIANHQTQDQAIPKLEELRLRHPGDPNPYVIGAQAYVRYLSIQQECTRFAMAQQGQPGADDYQH